MKKGCLISFLGIIIIVLGTVCYLVSKPDMVCTDGSIIDDISTLPDEKCKKIYDGKKVRISGLAHGVGYNPQGYLMLHAGRKFGKNHSWAVVVSFSQKSEYKTAKELGDGELFTAQGISEFAIIDNGDRVVYLWDSKFVE
ncbi:MAG: hypothetical protein MJ041_00685 [Acidaminococcaceae bacterium]|nr:hypothetical protein [Acidaminococcaceae bacterium]